MTIPSRQRPLQTKPRRTGQFSGVQVMFAAILTIGLFLAIDFSGRISAGQPVEQAYEQVSAEIDQLRREQSALIRQRDYVRSDAYVSLWARTEGKLVLPGETLVIPVPSAANVQPAPTPVFTPQDVITAPPGPEPWLLWWALFFDSPPPQLR
jgi:cell division protein FtsB